MMRKHQAKLLTRAGSLTALLLVLGACTPGGQFDPTTLLQNDMFDTKKKLQGDREPVFPNGVPGTTTGVPPDLVKGYQPPPDQAANPPDAAAAAPPEKPKPKPKPKVARAPAQPPTRINVGPGSNAPPTQNAPPPPSGQTNWPTPQQSAPQQSQSVWPAPPATNQQ
jgi:hypothetical protein